MTVRSRSRRHQAPFLLRRHTALPADHRRGPTVQDIDRAMPRHHDSSLSPDESARARRESASVDWYAVMNGSARLPPRRRP